MNRAMYNPYDPRAWEFDPANDQDPEKSKSQDDTQKQQVSNVISIRQQPTPPPLPDDLRPLPHAVGIEKAVLSVILDQPDHLNDLAHLPVEVFHLPPHQAVLAAIRELHAAGKSFEIVSLTQHLLDNGTLQRVGGPSALADLLTYQPSAAHFAQHLSILAEKYAARQAIAAARKLIADIEGEPEKAGEVIVTAARVLADSAPSSHLLAKAYSLLYSPDSPQPPDEVLMRLNDAPIAAQAGLTVIQGKAKAGKSAVVSSIIGAALRGRYAARGDTIDIEWAGDDPTGAVIHFDTEQSPGDWWGLATRGILRSGINHPEVVRRLISIPLVSFTVPERKALLESVMRDQHRKFGTISLVILDGVADICRDPNDPEESFELVRWLMELSHKYQTAIICILHENPSSDDGKTRGHLGSELQRKAYGNLRVEKDDDSVSVLFGPLMRKKDIPKHLGTCFAWSEEHRMHVTIGTQREVVAAKREEKATDAQARRDAEDIPLLREILTEPMAFSDLTFAVMDKFDIKKRGAETRISKWAGRLIVKNTEGKYLLK